VSALPSWLQIAGFVVGVAGGLTGTVLGIINLVLRYRENQPRLSVEAELEPTQEDGKTKQRPVITVRNKGSVSVFIDRLYFDAEHPTEGMVKIQIPETYAARRIPFRLESRDRERFEVAAPFMRERMSRRGFEGLVYVTATVVDGGANGYKSNPFRVDLSDGPARIGADG
jgi:hypothetical protein